MIDVNMLPFAIGVAISPIPIIAVILMLFSERAKSNGLSFALSWFFSVTIISFVVIFLFSGGSVMMGESAGESVQWVKIVLGIIMIGLAFKNLLERPKDGEEPEMPNWMSGIEKFTPVKSAGLAVLLSGINPKNLALIVSGALFMAESSQVSEAVGLNVIVFAFIASITVVVPVVYYVVAGEKAEKKLNIWKEWLSQNNAMVMFWLLLVIGVVLLVKGSNIFV